MLCGLVSVRIHHADPPSLTAGVLGRPDQCVVDAAGRSCGAAHPLRLVRPSHKQGFGSNKGTFRASMLQMTS